MKKLIIPIILILAIIACNRPQEKTNRSDQESIFSNDSVKFSNEHLLLAVLYAQTAAENRALCYQSYNTAKYMLTQDLKDKSVKQKRAVVLDLDETVLDNSPFEAKCILEGINYPDKWDEWCNKSEAKAIPGSVEFLKYADSIGVEIFYISNRKVKFLEATMKNLINLGCPQANETHLLFRIDDNSKEGRRQDILKSFHIALLIGDNLADFSMVFDGPLSSERRNSMTDSLFRTFGSQFIILPNAMYGDWEQSLYNWNSNCTEEEKKQLRKKNLRSF